MKIWIIGRGYPTTENRNWGSFEFEQAKLLSENGYEVVYIALTLSFFDRKDPRGYREFTDDKVSVFTYSHFYFPGKTGIYLETYEDKCWGDLFRRAETKSGVPNIIHVHYPTMLSSINQIEKYRKRGSRIFVTEHWSRVLIGNLRKHELKRLTYYAKNSSCFACVGSGLREAVINLVNDKPPLILIPNVVSPFFFQMRDNNKPNSDEFTFVAIGRLVGLKQFDCIIKQFNKVFNDNHKVRLKIIGTGNERKKLEKIAGNNNRIEFTGNLDLQGVAEELSLSDALVSFSKYETFCVPVTEAWALGKPVIVSDKSGVASYVNDDNGIVVRCDSEEDLGNALLNIIMNYGNYQKGNIISFAEDHFSGKAVVNLLDEMYKCY